MADADERFYREVIRAGYRGPYLKTLATDVAEGTLDLEELNDPELPDDEAPHACSRCRESARMPLRT